MVNWFHGVLLVVPLSLGAVAPVMAQSSLGLSFIEAEGRIEGGPDAASLGRVTGDFRITAAHGLQFDVTTRHYGDGFLGQLDGHLYMTPSRVSKYGLFASLADVEGREATIAMAGAEGIFALSDRTILEARGGIGYARPGSLDFIAASARVTYAVSERTALHAGIEVAEIDEVALRAVGHRLDIGISHTPGTLPVALTASVGRTGLTGRDTAPADTVFHLGLTWRFGTDRCVRRPVSQRSFSHPAPFDPLLRRSSF